MSDNNIKTDPELASDNSTCSETDQQDPYAFGSKNDPPRLHPSGPPPPPFLGPGLGNPAINISASLKAYADRMQADYFRYRLAKESADSFYSRLAAFQNTFNPFRYYLNPFNLRNFGPQGAGVSPLSPELPAVDMSLKPMGLLPKPPFPLPQLHSPGKFVGESGGKKRGFEENSEGFVSAEKKSKLVSGGTKRKPGKRNNVNDETSSPVSGTVIRQLGEGESLPEIRKGGLPKYQPESQFADNMTCLWRQTLWHVSLAVFLVSCYTPITRDTCP